MNIYVLLHEALIVKAGVLSVCVVMQWIQQMACIRFQNNSQRFICMTIIVKLPPVT